VNEDEELARLRWRSRRGLLELDLRLGRFVQRELSALTPAARRQYEALLELPDPDLLELLDGRREPMPGLAAVIRRIQQT
jgi:succinate dehydrogenase flavin-adding protein (antitoxin of CptAB toxin-antitoxin module)